MSWKDDLPDDLKSAPALKDIPDIATLAKSLVDTQIHLGNTMKLPKEDWSPEELKQWDQRILEKAGGRLIPIPDLSDPEQTDHFFRPLGKPESPDGYTVPEDLDISIPEDNLKRFRNQAHKANLTDAQQRDLLKHIAEDYKNVIEGQEQQVTDTTERLKVEWGTNIDAKRNELINKLKNVNAPTNVVELIANDKAGAETALFLDKVLTQIGTEGHEVGGQVGGPGVETPAGIEAQIAENDMRLTALYGQEQTNAVKRQIQLITQKNLELRTKRDSLR